MPCPSHDSKILKTRQPPCVHAPGVSMPSSGILAAGHRSRGSGRGVRRTNAGVGRRHAAGRSHRSSAGRTDQNINDDNKDNHGKGSKDEDVDFDEGVDVEEDGAGPRLLACPFYKFDPARHFRCYRKYELKRYSDVKMHILRCHNLGTLYCSKCWRTWKNNEVLLWENHASQNPPCQFVPEPESLHSREATALEELNVKGLSEYDKWYRMWDMLFICHQRPPSPYVEPGFGEMLLLIGHSHDSVLRELPLLLLELGIQVDHQAVQYLGNRIDGIYRQSLFPGQSQSPRYRRQHAIQQQQEPQLQMQEPQLQQPQAAGVESTAIDVIIPAQLSVDDMELYDVIRDMDGFMDEYNYQDAGLDDMMQFLDDSNSFASESPPPPLPSSSKEDSLERPAAPQVPLPNVVRVRRWAPRIRSHPRSDYRRPRARHYRSSPPKKPFSITVSKESQKDKSNSKYPALTGEDLFLLFLNRKYGLGQDMVYCLQMVPDQIKRAKISLGTGAAAESTTCQSSVVVGIDWPLRHFLKSQFVDEASRKQPFSSLITLTGFAADAQALTVGEYLSQTWPEIADKILQLLPVLLDPCLGRTPLRQGSPDANYKIDGSRLPRSSAGFFLDQVVISAGSMITGGAVLTPGVKELPPHLTRNGTIPQLKWLSKRYIVFWDEEVKRGWLVNGTSALLHIMRASLAQSEHDDSSACLMFDKNKMNNFPDKSYKHNTAMRVLIDQGNQGLVVYPDSISQTRKTSADSGNSTNTQTSTYFLFGDLAKKHFAALEQMIDYHSHLAGRDGINLKIRLRKHLEGWDFADLVNEIRPQPHVATIPTLGHGWVDFVRSIEAITLFGRKFGELLQPASRTGLCDRWSSLPQQDYLLAASVADLTSIMEQYGDPHAAPRELARNIIWHSPADTYAACPCKLSRASRNEKAAAYHVGPVQVLLPSGRLPPASGQRELEPDGAVAFGHNAIFGYRWPEKGTDEVPAKDFLVPLRNMLPVRLSKPQAESLDTLGNSETEVTSRIDSESSTSTPWVESPPSLRSSLRSLIPKRRSCTLQEENETVKKKLKTK
ncbi:hypothetical protein NHJ13734_003303 [Beauveria thailandica]